MKFNKILLLVSLICVSQAQSMNFDLAKNYVKESLKDLKGKAQLASFLGSFFWSRLSNNQKIASKVVVATAGLYAAKKLADSLNGQEESKKDSELSVQTEEESKRFEDALNYFKNMAPRAANFQQTKPNETVVEHLNQDQSKSKQLLKSFPGIGLILSDIQFTLGMINSSRIINQGKSVIIQYDLGSSNASKVVVIKQNENDEFSYTVVSNDIVHHG